MLVRVFSLISRATAERFICGKKKVHGLAAYPTITAHQAYQSALTLISSLTTRTKLTPTVNNAAIHNAKTAKTLANETRTGLLPGQTGLCPNLKIGSVLTFTDSDLFR